MSKFAGKCLGAALLLSGNAAMAALQIVSVDTPPSGTVDVDVNYTTAATVENFQADIAYDTAVLTFDSCAIVGAGGFAPVACTSPVAGTVRLLSSNIAGNDFASFAPLVTITFSIVGTPTVDTDLTFASSTYTAAGSVSVPPTDQADGAVSFVSGPAGEFALTPDPLNLAALQGGAAATGSITVANSGTAALTGVSCTYAGDAEITVAPFTTDLAVGASGTAAASCTSATAATYTGTYSCAAGAIADSSAVSCVVGPASAMAASTPATGSTITVSNVLAGGSSNGQILFAETNDQGVAYTVDSCAFTTGAAFAVTSTFPVAVAAGGSAAVGFSASAPADGTTPANDTLTCTTSTAQTFTFTTAITVRPPPPEVIPTLSQWAMMLMALVLAGFAGLSLRARKDFDV